MENTENFDVRNIQKELSDAYDALNTFENQLKSVTGQTGDLSAELQEVVGGITNSSDISEQLISYQEAITTYIAEQLKNQKNIEEKVLEAFEIQIKTLEGKKKQIDLEIEIKESIEESKDELLETLGASKELNKLLVGGGAIAIGFMAVTEAIDAAKESLTELFEKSWHLTHSIGLSYGNAVKFSAQLTKARFSMTRLLYGQEAVDDAAASLVEQYGNVNMATDKMIQSVTKLSELSGLSSDSAVDMAMYFKAAGVEVDSIKHILKDIAEEEGVSVNFVAKEFMENEELLIGATKDELNLLAKRSAKLAKEGKSRRDILSSAKQLLDIENLVNESNKIRLLTGEQINMNELAAAAMNVRIASGKEEKVKAEEELNRLIQEEIDKLGGVENMSQIVLESFESSIGTSKEQLMQIEKMKTSYSAFGNEVEDTNGLFASLTSVFGTFGEFLIGSASGFGQLILQAALFSFFMGGPVLKSFGLVLGAIKSGIVAAGSFIAKLLGIKAAQTTVAAGGAAASTLASGVGGNNFAGTGSRQAQAMAQNRGPGGRFSGGFKPPPGPAPGPAPGPTSGAAGKANAMGGINATSLIKGAAALLIMAAALFVFAKALQEMSDVGMDEVGIAAASIGVLGLAMLGLSKLTKDVTMGSVAMLIMAGAVYVLGLALQQFTNIGAEQIGAMIASLFLLTAAMIGLGFLLANPITAAAFATGVIAFLALGAALIVLGAGLKSVGEGVVEFSKLSESLTLLASMAGGIALFGAALIPLGIGLAALAIGLAVIKPVLPTLVGLVALGAGIALIANALGYGGGSSEESSSSKNSTLNNQKQSDPLLEEIRGLRADIKAQPINVVLNNKIVGEINRASRASNSYVNK